MATSDAPLYVPNVTLAVARGSGPPPIGSLQLVAETGFSITGQVADLAEVTITGQDFGTKPPQRHFDRIDRYWANGTEVVDPYGTPSEGDQLTTTFANPNAPFRGDGSTDLQAWRLKSEAARNGRTLGYQLDSGPDGDMEFYGIGSTNQGFQGWPAAQRDSEEVYIRFWHYQEYFGSESESILSANALQGATSVNLTTDNFGFSDTSPLREVYIELDSGDLHFCIQTTPKTSSTSFTFDPPLPSAASAGNSVYDRKENVMKLMRMRDDGEGNGLDSNAYSFSGFRSEISNDDLLIYSGRTQAQFLEGRWQLHEIYMRAPKEEARLNTDYIKKVRIDGDLRLERVGLAAMNDGNPGGAGEQIPPNNGWPSSGLAITFFGFEQDRLHRIPNNFVRYSDIYVDGQAVGIGVRRRVEIGIGNDDLYLCSNREPCPIKTWSTDITVNFNALPFTESELAQARIFVVDADDVPTLVGRIQ